MPRKPNTPLRVLVPTLAAALGLAVVVSVLVNTGKQGKAPDETVQQDGQQEMPEDIFATKPAEIAPPTGTPGDGEAADQTGSPSGSQTGDQPQTGSDEPGTPTAGPAAGPAPTQGTASAGTATGLHIRVLEGTDEPLPVLGSLDPDSDYTAQIEFTRAGAGVRSMKLANYSTEVDSNDHVELQAQKSITRKNGTQSPTAVPFALLRLEVNGQNITMMKPSGWRPITDSSGNPLAGEFESFVDDADGNPVLRVVRRFEFEPKSFDIHVDQYAENLTDRQLSVRFIQTGPIDLPPPATKYGGEKRRVRFGYLLNEVSQAGATQVTADHELKNRMTYLGKKTKSPSGVRKVEAIESLWPNGAAKKNGYRLVWTAFTNRYFGVAVHQHIDPSNPGEGGKNLLFSDIESVDRLVLDEYGINIKSDDNAVVMQLTTVPFTVAPGGRADNDLGVYAGPLLPQVFQAEPVAQALHLDGMIAYSHGGMCAFCTFEWLTHTLLWVLKLFHSISGDWAIAIIMLVITVKAALHPIARWSQIRMQRFGAQMQAIGPKQQKIKEKFKDDPQRLQQEMAKIWKEEGINPAGMLGCLPMFLQTPVWIAMYAVLFFAAELRHEPAFYGVFQSISGGHWHFLADLASPDHAITLPASMHFTPPLIGGLYGTVKSINLLPLLLGIVFFIQQKYLTPPSTGTTTPEQEQMQKTMKVMSVVMFPVFMYTAPSGLALYFITNSTLGILEARWIRAHATKHGLIDPEKLKEMRAQKRKTAKKGGFLERLQAAAEAQQQLRQQQGGAARKQVSNTARKPEPPNRQYKKRK